MSKKIKNLYLQAALNFILTYILCMVLWPLFDLLWSNIITHSEFHYSPLNYLVEPIVISLIATLVFYGPKISKSKKETK